MKSWQIYRGPSGGIEAVKEGFNFWAFFFPGFWGFAKGLPGAGIVGLCGPLALNRLPEDFDSFALILTLALMLCFGTLANSWVINSLLHHEYQYLGTLKARNKKGAELVAKNFYTPAPETES
jgi:hypothetical protein